MGFDDTYNHPNLVLGLGFSNEAIHTPTTVKPEQDDRHSSENLESPSLILSLSSCGDQRCDSKKAVVNVRDDLHRQDSVGASSISHVTLKRERNDQEDDEDEDGGSAAATANGKKLRLTKAQSAMLEESFKYRNSLNPKQKQELAKELHLRPRQVEVWFQNRRARSKLKQTEVDCEFLKKCCETLTEENKRLQKEIQELKSLKYNNMPAASATGKVTICPSCERIGGVVVAGENTSKNSLFNLASKHHMLNNNNLLANQSAAC